MLFNLRTALMFASLSFGGIAAVQSAVLERYEETFRPRYHFSPETGWIGDPDGLIHYGGNFSLFWWREAKSTRPSIRITDTGWLFAKIRTVRS